MALTITTQDLENYPGITKQVSLDISSVVPTGYDGDEQIVMSVSTNAYSNISTRTTIPSKYLMGFKTGWCKSSGLVGSAGKFNVDSTHYKLKIKIDATNSGIDNSGYYEIALAYNGDDTPISGEDIATDMETKIQALADTLVTADTGFTLAYSTAQVEYRNGRR